MSILQSYYPQKFYFSSYHLWSYLVWRSFGRFKSGGGMVSPKKHLQSYYVIGSGELLI